MGVSSKDETAIKNADLVIKSIVDMIETEDIENVALYKTEFLGYGGKLPSLEIIIPDKGNVVFGNVDSNEAIRLIKKYLKDTSEIEEFLVDNNGTKRCNH
ncbi:hypothetical protein [Psychrilyobacter atlanticus]|uniref:hypothetical protein n=1 Tax=Psychrilyobacter atlanticus TaxID=271091 RepID=UPI0003FA9CF2|nr:hypothetical protein [Psychrilyobacter atlanticus]